jgi:hypothetical protein
MPSGCRETKAMMYFWGEHQTYSMKSSWRYLAKRDTASKPEPRHQPERSRRTPCTRVLS